MNVFVSLIIGDNGAPLIAIGNTLPVFVEGSKPTRVVRLWAWRFQGLSPDGSPGGEAPGKFRLFVAEMLKI